MPRTKIVKPRDNDYRRFMRKVRKRPDGCWEWQGGEFEDGYPGFWVKGRTVRGNRYVLERKLGRPLREGEQALHSCDFKRCVRGSHIYAGTHRDNMDDMKKRGNARGIPKSEAWKAKMAISMLGNQNGKRR